MSKVKLTAVAKECGAKNNKEILEKAIEMGLDVKSISSSITEEEADALYNYITTGENTLPKKEKTKKTTKKDTKTSKTKKTKATSTDKKKMESKAKKSTKDDEKTKSEPKTTKVRQDKQTAHIANIQIKPAKPKTESKPKTSKTKISPQKNEKEIEEVINIDRGFNYNYDYEQNEVMLFDLYEQEFHNEEEHKSNQELIKRIKTQRKNPWVSEGSIRRSKRKTRHTIKEAPKEIKDAISIPSEVRVYEFAQACGRDLKDVISTLFNLGLMATKNDFLDKDAIEILADEFKIQVTIVDENLYYEEINKDEKQNLQKRAPVVTIMGHVDHGKTSLLDFIRKSKIAAKEAGGITQHIGAYMVEKNGQMISFIDTPGHEAFSSMRSRGAQVTDIAVIVIAADDGVKPQTIEALQHAKEANVQIIIAMNKMDKESANPDKLKAECAELGFTPNDWGGNYEFIPISAKTGAGVDILLETILLQADLMELKANFEGRANAIVLEGKLEKGLGAVASVIVKNGILRIGDPVVADMTFGKIRAMSDELGRPIKELYPSYVAQVIGLSEVPEAGSMLIVTESDIKAREYAQKTALHLRQKELSKSTKVTLEELKDMIEDSITKLSLIIKADTQGSLEAIKYSLEALNNDEVKVNILKASIGSITENDITLATSSSNQAIVIGFNSHPIGNAKTKAKELNVQIKTYSIIYELIEDMKEIVSALMSPIISEENVGKAKVCELFNIPKGGIVAGCIVDEGNIQRNNKVRVLRNGELIHTGTISSLKRFKNDVKEVNKGHECGILINGFSEFQVEDIIEAFKEVKNIAKI